MDEITFEMNEPLTEEDLDMIYDVDYDRTAHVTISTKHGRDVKFVKADKVVEWLKARWITTRNNHGRLETIFRGGLTEILEEMTGGEMIDKTGEKV